MRYSPLARRLGVASPPYTVIHLATFLITSSLGIAFLVFLNAGQAFVLTDLLEVPKEKASTLAGTLVFADELLALALVLVWGRLADKYSPKMVVVISNILVGLALFLFVEAKNVFPQLLLARLLFASGSSGITAMLSAILSILSSTPIAPTPSIPDEDQPLIGWRRPTPPSISSVRKSTRLAALLGLSTGIGALLAVFLFLRLPNKIGLKSTFRLVGGLALSTAIFAMIGLPTRSVRAAKKENRRKIDSKGRGSILREIIQLGRGFELARGNKDVALGYAAGFAARAQTITTSAFIPIFVAYFYQKHGLCDPMPGQDIKTGCHPAYSFSSALTGVIQLTALITSAFLSLVHNPSRMLTFSFLLGSLSFFILGRSMFRLGGEDPRNVLTWLGAVGIGISQISGIVLSLGVVASARERLLTSQLEKSSRTSEGTVAEDNASSTSTVTEPEDAVIASILSSPSISSSVSSEDSNLAILRPFIPIPPQEEIAGALSGGYSFCGGLGILVVSGIGGLLAERAGPAVPFILVAAIDLALVGVAAWANYGKS